MSESTSHPIRRRQRGQRMLSASQRYAPAALATTPSANTTTVSSVARPIAANSANRQAAVTSMRAQNTHSFHFCPVAAIQLR